MSQKPPYAIAGKQSIAATDDLRVTLMRFDPGQEIPWHTHSAVTDTSFCLEGRVEMSLDGPEDRCELAPGQWRAVEPGRAHRVRCLGPEPCAVLLVQGVGAYDFLPRA